MSEDFTAPETGAEPAIEPVETAAPETQATETPPTEEQPPENKGKDRLQARFSELTGRIKAEQEEKEYWRQQALRTAPEPPPAQEYYEDPYSPEAIQAVVQRTLAEERQNAAQREAQTAQAQKAQSLQSKLFESGLEGAVAIASGENIPFTQAMIDVLAVSEHAAQVAHHLGTNPSEAARIAALPPQLQGFELATLTARLASQPKTTNAPPPPSTVGARGAPASGPSDSMSMSDWLKARNAQRGR